MTNLYIPLIAGKCNKPLFAGSELSLYYKPHTYSISAGSGVNWRNTRKRV